MKVYVNWYDEEVLTKEGLDKRIAEMIEDDVVFIDFLEYACPTLDYSKVESREPFLKEFAEWAKENTIIEDFKEIEIE